MQTREILTWEVPVIQTGRGHMLPWNVAVFSSWGKNLLARLIMCFCVCVVVSFMLFARLRCYWTCVGREASTRFAIGTPNI